MPPEDGIVIYMSRQTAFTTSENESILQDDAPFSVKIDPIWPDCIPEGMFSKTDTKLCYTGSVQLLDSAWIRKPTCTTGGGE